MKILYFLVGFILATNCEALKIEESSKSAGGVTQRQISIDTNSSSPELLHKRQSGNDIYCESAKIMMNAMINGTIGNLSEKEKKRLAYGFDRTKFLVKYYNAFNAMYSHIDTIRYNFRTYPRDIENIFSSYKIYTINDLIEAVTDADSVLGTREVMCKLSIADACCSNAIPPVIDQQMSTCLTNISINLKNRIEKDGKRALDMFKQYGVHTIKDLIENVNGDYGLEYLYVILGYLMSISVTEEGKTLL